MGGGGVGGLGSSGAGASAASADVKQAFVLLLAAYNEQSDSIKYNPAMHLTALCPPLLGIQRINNAITWRISIQLVSNDKIISVVKERGLKRNTFYFCRLG